MSDSQARYDRSTVRGLKDVTGVVSPRLDIDVFLKTQPDAFNLFLLALDDLKSNRADWKDDPMSYFQIAGIHGLPKILWEGVSSTNKKDKGTGSGYCAHRVTTFPTWHRPYLAMMEQTIYNRMAALAKQWTGSRGTDYQTALKTFRLPYWDYYRPRNYYARFSGRTLPDGQTASQYDYSMPQIFTLTKVMVQMPGEKTLTPMDNPLTSFNFPKGALLDSEWDLADLSTKIVADITKRTIRYGQSRDPIADMNQALNKIREDNLRMSLNLIEHGAYDNYEVFATKADIQPVQLQGTDPNAAPNQARTIFTRPSGSIEGLHGTYHIMVGGWDDIAASKKQAAGSGHMSSVPVAAFDPVFWMHHCQIDRLFAVWQAAHPGSWFASKDDAEDYLRPFRRYPESSNNRYWDSDMSRDTKRFGYTYPDLERIENDKEAVKDRFQKKYGWDRRLTPFQVIQGPADDMQPLELKDCQVFKYPAGSQWAKEFKPLVKQDAEPAKTFSRLVSIKEEKASHFDESAPSAPPESDAPAPIVIGSGEIDESKVSREWYVDEVVEALTRNGSFAVFYFIGEIGASQPSEWLRLPSFAGLNHNFAAPVEACDNCGVAAEGAHLVTDTTPITSTLLDCVEMHELESMRPEHVRPFLIQNLKWRVVTTKGEIVDPRELGSFEVSVSCKVAPRPGQEGDVTYEVYPDITAAIIGNASPTMSSA